MRAGAKQGGEESKHGNANGGNMGGRGPPRAHSRELGQLAPGQQRGEGAGWAKLLLGVAAGEAEHEASCRGGGSGGGGKG